MDYDQARVEFKRLGLSTRASNVMVCSGYRTKEQIKLAVLSGIIRPKFTRNFGSACYAEVCAWVGTEPINWTFETKTKLRQSREQHLLTALEALVPFAKFGKRLMDGRTGTPLSGPLAFAPWYDLDKTQGVTLDIEHFKAAIEIVDGMPFEKTIAGAEAAHLELKRQEMIAWRNGR